MIELDQSNNTNQSLLVEVDALIIHLWTNKRLIFTCSALCFMVFILLIFTKDDKFRSSAVILPPEQASDKFSELSNQISRLPFMSGVQGGKSGIDTLELIKAHLSKEKYILKIFSENNLYESYDLPPNTPYHILRENLFNFLSIGKDQDSGLVKIVFESEKPSLAQKTVSLVVKSIQEISMNNQLLENKRKMDFIQMRFKEVTSDLKEIEEHIATFMRSNRLLDIPSQIQATIQLLSKLESEKRILETKLQVRYKMGNSRKHPQTLAIETEIQAIESQLLQVRDTKIDDNPKFDNLPDFLYVSLKQIPEIRIELERLSRRKEVLKELYLTLAKELEVAKIKLASDREGIEVIQSAILPIAPFSPKRDLLLFLSLITSFIIGVTISFLSFLIRHWNGLIESRRQI